jgi:hypothetical protein
VAPDRGIRLSICPKTAHAAALPRSALGHHADFPDVPDTTGAPDDADSSVPFLVEGAISSQILADTARQKRQCRIEMGLGGLVLAALVFVTWRLSAQGYLPQPFYYRLSESLMDLYTPALWANHGDAYGRWRSLYPPLSFVYLKLTSLADCYGADDLAGRQCDWLARLTLFGVFLGNLVLVYRSYQIADRLTALPRAIAMGLGLPMLYALERGNLLIPCFTCFVLGYGDLIRRGWIRCLALAAAMNFKPYLVFVVVPMIIKRRWAGVAACAVLGGAIYGATALAYGSGWPLQIIANETSYASAPSKSYFSDLYFATSYWPLIHALHGSPAMLGLGSARLAAFWGFVLTVALRGTQLAALACLTLALFRPAGAQIRRLAALAVAVAITAFTTGSAGYSQIFLFFLVFYERWRSPIRIAVLLATYMLCLPIDYVLLPVLDERVYSWLGGREVTASFGVSIGQLVRPGLLLLIQTGLVVLNLRDIIRGREDEARPAARCGEPSAVHDAPTAQIRSLET